VASGPSRESPRMSFSRRVPPSGGVQTLRRPRTEQGVTEEALLPNGSDGSIRPDLRIRYRSASHLGYPSSRPGWQAAVESIPATPSVVSANSATSAGVTDLWTYLTRIRCWTMQGAKRRLRGDGLNGPRPATRTARGLHSTRVGG
jgi:hypothetical protein